MSPNYDLTLYESLAVLAYKTKIKPWQHQLLSEWLGCYNYIIPDSRTLNESALYITPIDNSHASYMALWYLTQILQTNYYSNQQSNIIRYIQCYLPKPQIRPNLPPQHKTQTNQSTLDF
jgi:hypothetical protein